MNSLSAGSCSGAAKPGASDFSICFSTSFSIGASMMRIDLIKSSLYELYPEIQQLGLYPVVLKKGNRF
jgi:hypothetical protein